MRRKRGAAERTTRSINGDVNSTDKDVPGYACTCMRVCTLGVAGLSDKSVSTVCNRRKSIILLISHLFKLILSAKRDDAVECYAWPEAWRRCKTFLYHLRICLLTCRQVSINSSTDMTPSWFLSIICKAKSSRSKVKLAVTVLSVTISTVVHLGSQINRFCLIVTTHLMVSSSKQETIAERVR